MVWESWMARDHTWNRESLEFPDWDRAVLRVFDIFLMVKQIMKAGGVFSFSGLCFGWYRSIHKPWCFFFWAWIHTPWRLPLQQQKTGARRSLIPLKVALLSKTPDVFVNMLAFFPPCRKRWNMSQKVSQQNTKDGCTRKNQVWTFPTFFPCNLVYSRHG